MLLTLSDSHCSLALLIKRREHTDTDPCMFCGFNCKHTQQNHVFRLIAPIQTNTKLHFILIFFFFLFFISCICNSLLQPWETEQWWPVTCLFISLTPIMYLTSCCCYSFFHVLSPPWFWPPICSLPPNTRKYWSLGRAEPGSWLVAINRGRQVWNFCALWIFSQKLKILFC